MVFSSACVRVVDVRSFGRAVLRVVTVSLSKRHFLFGPEQRLHHPAEFSAVLASRLMVRGGQNVPFVLHYRLLDHDNPSRLGIVVPKRYAKAASLRNAIKRQGREAFRLIVGELPPCDLVFRLNRSLGVTKSRDLLKQKEWRMMMDTLLRRIPTTPQSP